MPLVHRKVNRQTVEGLYLHVKNLHTLKMTFSQNAIISSALLRARWFVISACNRESNDEVKSKLQ